MTTGHTRVSSAGLVADAIATFLDDGFRLRSDAVSARRRLVASLCAVAVPLIDGGGRQVTRLVNRAGETVWRGARKAEQLGAQVADEAADAGREGARAVRDAATARQGGSSHGSSSGGRELSEGEHPTGREFPASTEEEFVDVVEVIEIVEPDLGGVDLMDLDAAGGLSDEGLAAESLVVDEVDDELVEDMDDDLEDIDQGDVDEDLLDAGLPAEEALPEPAPAVLLEAAEIGGDRGEVDEVVSEETVERITGDAVTERRTPRRETPTRPRSASRPARRDRPREDRRETASNGSRERRS